MLGYLRSLNSARSTLWCYFIWYVTTVVTHFDASPRLWLTSLGLSGIIGVGLLLSTAHGGASPTPLNRWQVVRLFLMPFCVSSFAALVKTEGYVLVFSPRREDNWTSIGACTVFLLVVWLSKSTASPRRAKEFPLPRSDQTR